MERLGGCLPSERNSGEWVIFLRRSFIAALVVFIGSLLVEDASNGICEWRAPIGAVYARMSTSTSPLTAPRKTQFYSFRGVINTRDIFTDGPETEPKCRGTCPVRTLPQSFPSSFTTYFDFFPVLVFFKFLFLFMYFFFFLVQLFCKTGK